MKQLDRQLDRIHFGKKQKVIFQIKIGTIETGVSMFPEFVEKLFSVRIHWKILFPVPTVDTDTLSFCFVLIEVSYSVTNSLVCLTTNVWTQS